MIRHNLHAVEGQPFRIGVAELVAFPNVRRARIIAVELDRPPQLEELHREVGRALAATDQLELEARPYRPHVTLGRVKSATSGAVSAFFRDVTLPALPPVDVTAFSLYASHLSREGARYQRLEQYEFG